MQRLAAVLHSEAIIAGALVAGAVVTVIATLKILLANPDQFGFDLPAYVEGARRLVASGSPYSLELHAGTFENIRTDVGIGYLYPPPVAQLFVPLLSVPIAWLAWGWTVAQAAILLVLLPTVYRRYGGRWDRGHVAGILIAAVAFSPNLVALYIGNVSGWIAICVGLMLIAGAPARAVSAVSVMWLKLTPGVFALGALIDRSTRDAAVIAGLAILAVSFALSPSAWADWIAVLPSIVGLPQAPYTANLAPVHVLSSTGFALLADLARVAVPVWFGVLLIVSAWRGQLAAWIAAAAGVYLSVGGTVWDHYFAVLSPLAVAAWPRATPVGRMSIVAVLVALGPLWFLKEQEIYQLLGLGLWLAFLTSAVFQFGGGLTVQQVLGPTRKLALKRQS